MFFFILSLFLIYILIFMSWHDRNLLRRFQLPKHGKSAKLLRLKRCLFINIKWRYDNPFVGVGELGLKDPGVIPKCFLFI